MLIDQMMEEIKKKNPDAKGFLEKLIVDHTSGQTSIRCQFGCEAIIGDGDLLGPESDKFVEESIKAMLVRLFEVIKSTSIAMGMEC